MESGRGGGGEGSVVAGVVAIRNWGNGKKVGVVGRNDDQEMALMAVSNSDWETGVVAEGSGESTGVVAMISDGKGRKWQRVISSRPGSKTRAELVIVAKY